MKKPWIIEVDTGGMFPGYGMAEWTYWKYPERATVAAKELYKVNPQHKFRVRNSDTNEVAWTSETPGA